MDENTQQQDSSPIPVVSPPPEDTPNPGETVAPTPDPNPAPVPPVSVTQTQINPGGQAMDVVNIPVRVEKKVEEEVKFGLGRYNKAIVGLVGTVLTYLTIHYGTNHIVQDAIMIATVLGVYQFKNL